MSNPGNFQEKVARLAETDPAYAPEAYLFLRDALEAAVKTRRKSRKENSPHVSAGELLEAFRDYALGEFGPMALTVLDYWGVRSCEDVGQLVFKLVDAGIFGKTDADTIESFRGHFDFEEAFLKPFQSQA